MTTMTNTQDLGAIINRLFDANALLSVAASDEDNNDITRTVRVASEILRETINKLDAIDLHHTLTPKA